MQVAVIGLGKLGLPFALFLASRGQQVFCYDKNLKILNQIKKKKSPYIEPLVDNYLKKFSKNIIIQKNLTNIVKFSKIIHIVLPTPSKKDNSFSNDYIQSCLKDLSKLLIQNKNKNTIINITSTVMPTSCKNVFVKFLQSKGLKNERDFSITYNPHFIAQGSTIFNLENPDFILIGANDLNGRKLKNYYQKIYKKKNFIELMNTTEAEITKISVNSYITTKITFSNFISEICEKTEGTDAKKVLGAIGKDHRIGNKYLGVGTKFSGPCFPRDNKALNFFLKKKIKHSLPLEVDKINNLQTKRLSQFLFKVIKINRLKKANIGILGLTYKDKTNIIKDSQSYDLIKEINKKNNLSINVLDHNITSAKNFTKKYNFNFFKDSKKFLNSSNLLVLMYPSKNFIDICKNSKSIIVDCWNVINEKSSKSKVYKLGKFF